MGLGKILKGAHKFAGGARFQGVFLALSTAALLKSGITGAWEGGHNLNTGDPQTFEKMGNSAGEVAGNIGMLGLDTFFMGDIVGRKLGTEAMQTGKYVFQQEGNMLKGLGRHAGSDIAKGHLEYEAALGNAKTGTYFKKAGKFLPNTPGKYIFGGMAALIAGSVVAPMMLGFAGKVADAAFQDARNSKTMNYDQRFISSQQYDHSTYEQTGLAMQNLQNRMISSARIYHSHG